MRTQTLVVLLAALATSVAHAGETVRWAIPAPTAGNPTAAVSYGDATLATSTYVAIDKTLYGYRTADGTSFGMKSAAATAAIQNFPSVVPLTTGTAGRFIFVGSQDGYLYKINADTMAKVGSPKRIRRTGCASDYVQATPTVQLAAYSAGFTPNRDLVFVATYRGCGDKTGNQIIAVDADTMATVWTFNSGEYEMDFVSAGCSLDYDRNRLYCGSNLPTSTFQNTVWAINTNDGTLVWAGNFNGVRTRPQLGRGALNHLYVADMLGTVHAIDRDTGTEHWSLPLTSHILGGGSVTQNMWAEFRAPYANMLFVTDSKGVLHAIYDGGKSAGMGSELWKTTFAASKVVTSLGSVSPTLGKLYVGLSDLSVHQLDMSSGLDEANRTVNTAAVTVGDRITDPTLHLDGTTEISALIVSANTAAGGAVTKQFPVPWNNGTTGASLTDCTSDAECAGVNRPFGCMVGSTTIDCCNVGACNLATKTCYSKPVTIGGHSCNDGKGNPQKPGTYCTKNRRCQAGACIGDWDTTSCAYGATFCSVDPQRACGFSSEVINGKPVTHQWTCSRSGSDGQMSCSNPDTDVDACGGNGRTCGPSAKRTGDVVWGGDRFCNRGVCEREDAYCTEPSLGSLQSAVATEQISGLAFQRVFNVSGNKYECGLVAPQFSTTKSGNNSAIRVSPAGTKTQVPADEPPGHMTGIATVPHLLNEFFTTFTGNFTPGNNGPGRYDLSKNQVTHDLGRGNVPTNERPLPTAGITGGGVPFRFGDFNFGASPPASDDVSLGSGGRLFYGNWRENGDVWILYYNTNSSNPPLGYRAKNAIDGARKWCSNTPCEKDERIVALDYVQGNLTDGYLRVAVKTAVYWVDLGQKKVLDDKTVDLKQGYWEKPKWPFAAKDIVSILSLSCDPLNGTRGCFAEVRDTGGDTYIVHIGDDSTTRLYSDMLSSHYQNAWPPLRKPVTLTKTNYKDADGRVNVSAQQSMYRIVPVKPDDKTTPVPIIKIPMPR